MPTNILLFKKFLNLTYYNKSLLRNVLLNNNKLNLVDNYYNLEILQATMSNKSLDGFVTGTGLTTKSFTYTNRLNPFIKFKLNSCSSDFNKGLPLNSLEKTLTALVEKTNKFNTFILLTPIKGGFKSYSAGLFGFLPSNQLKTLFFSFEKSILKYSQKGANLQFFEYFKHPILTNKTFIFRFPLYIGKISIYPEFKKNNFSKAKKVKPKIFQNDLNIVFLAQPFENKVI